LGWETDFWSSSSTLGFEETLDSSALGVELKTKEGGGTEWCGGRGRTSHQDLVACMCVCVCVCVVRTQQTTHGTRYLPAHYMQSLLPPRVTQHRQTLLPPHYTQSLNSTPTLAITTHHAYALFPDNLRPHLEPESMPFNAANSSSTCVFVGCCVGRSSVGCTHLERHIETH
jgi:hypothetical protein